MAVCVCVCVCVYVRARACGCLPPRLFIASSVIWTPYDYLNKFYSFYMAAIVDIVDACSRNQPNKSKLVLCKLWIHFKRHLKQLYSSNKMDGFSYKGRYGVHEHKHIEMLKRRAGLGYRYTVLDY